MKLKSSGWFIGSIILFSLIGCGTTSMMMTVKRPAEINLKDYNKMAVGDITDESGRKSAHSQDVTDALTTTLFESKNFE
jgi:hypothetical protein